MSKYQWIRNVKVSESEPNICMAETGGFDLYKDLFTLRVGNFNSIDRDRPALAELVVIYWCLEDRGTGP
jgi:hypothetical protein